jgi:cardiolipin synthase
VTDRPASDRILTIPNLVSLVRLGGVGLFWWLLFGPENVALAGLSIFVIGWTDWIDGYLARRLDQVSKFGTMLDPIADRLMIASALVGGLVAGVVPGLIAWPLIAREAVMALITIYLVVRGAGILEVRKIGKWATFILYGAIPTFYFAEAGILTVIAEPLAWTTGVVGLALYWFAVALYIGDARQELRELESSTSH